LINSAVESSGLTGKRHDLSLLLVRFIPPKNLSIKLCRATCKGIPWTKIFVLICLNLVQEFFEVRIASKNSKKQMTKKLRKT